MEPQVGSIRQCLSLYVFDGYRGNVMVRITDKTSIEASLKVRLKPGARMTFTTDGTATKSEPPQVTALTIQSVTEVIVYKGRVKEVADGRIIDAKPSRQSRYRTRVW